MEVLSLVNQTVVTKARINFVVAEHINELAEGNASITKSAESIAAIEEFCKQFRESKTFVEMVRDEVIKHNGKLTMPSGTVIEVTEAGVSYDYTHDAEWMQLNYEAMVLKEKIKAREQLLRSAQPGQEKVDPDTGEVFIGANKTSKSTYRVTLQKK